MIRFTQTVLVAFAIVLFSTPLSAASSSAGDLTPIGPSDWNRARAAHLL